MKSFAGRSNAFLKGSISLPGDKSIAHRAIIFSSLANSKTLILNLPLNDDIRSTIHAFRKLGINIVLDESRFQVIVYGKGLKGLTRSLSGILIKESGTTFRLLLGLLAGQNFTTNLNAGKSLCRRPMLRVIHPLRLMGASIKARKIGKEEYPPVVVEGAGLRGICYKPPIASAQVKSAILLAGLFSDGVTKVIERIKTRDHTERMLKLFKSSIKVSKNAVTVSKIKSLVSPLKIRVPGDISSAAFFIVGATILNGSNIRIKDCSLNPGRTGFLRVLKRMGARIRVTKDRNSGFEPSGDILVKSSGLRGVKVSSKDIPFLIDELPILMIAACFAKGKTVFKDVSELRVKETDRIFSMVDNLTKMGAFIKVRKTNKGEDLVITGTGKLHGARVKSFGDHRTAMSMAIAGIAAVGVTQIKDFGCTSKSFPGFFKALKGLIP